MIKYSIFTPVYNEEGNLLKLYNEVKDVMNKLGEPWEFVFINDGSTDNSMKELLSINDKNVRIIALKKNYGQSVAMDAGFRTCNGEIIISIDADLQNDPKDIPKLLKKLNDEHYDVVTGWRYKRKDPFWMIFVTLTARFLRGIFVKDGIHDSGCTLRVYRKNFIDDLELWGEMHRYIIALLRWKGARVAELKVNHRPRNAGVSKYNITKSLRGFVDLFYIWFWKKFSGRPLHLFGILGLGFIGFGLLSSFWTIFLKVFNHVSLSDSVWFIMSSFLLFVGFQFFITGITLDILIRNNYNNSLEKRYKIREIVKHRKR